MFVCFKNASFGVKISSEESLSEHSVHVQAAAMAAAMAAAAADAGKTLGLLLWFF